MSKLTNKDLQAVKKNLYTVHTFDKEGTRSCTIGGANIVRAMEEMQNWSSLALVYERGLDETRIPKAVYEELGVRESSRTDAPVWMWLLEFEAPRKRRATWQEVQQIYALAKEWVRQNPTEVA